MLSNESAISSSLRDISTTSLCVFQTAVQSKNVDNNSASVLPNGTSATATICPDVYSEKKKEFLFLLCGTIGGVLIVFLLGLLIFLYWKRRRRYRRFADAYVSRYMSSTRLSDVGHCNLTVAWDNKDLDQHSMESDSFLRSLEDAKLFALRFNRLDAGSGAGVTPGFTSEMVLAAGSGQVIPGPSGNSPAPVVSSSSSQHGSLLEEEEDEVGDSAAHHQNTNLLSSPPSGVTTSTSGLLIAPNLRKSFQPLSNKVSSTLSPRSSSARPARHNGHLEVVGMNNVSTVSAASSDSLNTVPAPSVSPTGPTAPEVDANEHHISTTTASLRPSGC